MIFPVVGQALVEGAVLLCGDVGRVASPDRFCLVELLIGDLRLLDLLLLLLFSLILLVVDLFNFGLFFLVFFCFLFVFYLLQRRLSMAIHNADAYYTFSTSFVTVSWMGYEINSECFLTISLIFFSSRYSSWSSLR